MKFCVKLGMALTQNFENMLKQIMKFAVSLGIVFKWPNYSERVEIVWTMMLGVVNPSSVTL